MYFYYYIYIYGLICKNIELLVDITISLTKALYVFWYIIFWQFLNCNIKLTWALCFLTICTRQQSKRFPFFDHAIVVASLLRVFENLHI